MSQQNQTPGALRVAVPFYMTAQDLGGVKLVLRRRYSKVVTARVWARPVVLTETVIMLGSLW